MILQKSHLLFGGIKKIIKAVFSFIYKILKFFNLQLALLVVLVGVILFFAGVFEGNVVIEMVFYIILIASIFYGVVATVKKILFPNKKEENKRSKVEIVKKDEEEKLPSENGEPQQEETLVLSKNNASVFQQAEIVVEKPKYYKVKQNPNFIMAEFLDRFELYEKTSNGLKKVRTDYKENLR